MRFDVRIIRSYAEQRSPHRRAVQDDQEAGELAVALLQDPGSVDSQLLAHVGRHTQKLWDWDAFPASKGYPELARAQMRYIGAGGSPKVGDTSTLPPSCFTCSCTFV